MTERQAVLGWLVSRAAMLLLSLSWTRDSWSLIDVGLYADWASRVFAGQEPARNLDEYPPLAQAGLASLGWASDPVTYAAFFMAAMAVVDLLFLLWIVRESKENSTGVLLWIVAPGLLGALVWTRFDILPAVGAAIALSQRQGAVQRGLTLGTAIALKLWPLILLPSVVGPLRRPWQSVAAVAAVVTAGFALPLLVLDSEPLGPFWWMAQRGVHVESTPGSLLALAGSLGADISTGFDFGAWQIYGTGTRAVSAIWTAAGAVFVVSLVVLARRARLRSAHGVGARLVGLALVSALLVFTKVLSPQYLLWLVAPTASVMSVSNLKNRWPIAVVLGIACAMTHVVYPLSYTALLDLEPWAVVVLLLRNGALAAALCLFCMELRVACSEGNTDPIALSVAQLDGGRP